MATITVDGSEYEVDGRLTLFQALQSIGKEVPHFCFHERLSIAGNCRMCLVEVEKAPKPVASCAQPIMDGMVVFTDSEKTIKARKGVMEFLLINHPLDCPICDQGGECDLQDQAMAYGHDRTRFEENKRAVHDKEMGPLVKTIMTRCIHCTRCIRFAEEVAGVEEIGALHRGEHMEIATYLERSLTSELSGNVIDLCPVGALTSKPYAFTARSWELRKTESIDVMDAVGSNIRVDSRGAEVMRVLPRLNDDINEEWISDKTRFACDGLKRQRLDRPYVRRDGRLEPASWSEAFAAIADRIAEVGGAGMAAIAGDQADCEAMMALKDLFAACGSGNIDCRQDGAKVDPSVRAGYLFNSGIAGIDDADALLLIGANPRIEAAVLNARIRRRWRAGGFRIGLIGEAADLTYRFDHLGAGAETLAALAGGDHGFADVLGRAERPMLIVGPGVLARDDGVQMLGLARAAAERFGMVRDGWNGFNVLHTAASRVGGLDLGFAPGPGGRDTAAILDRASAGGIGLVWLLGADEIDMERLGEAFVVYQGHHGDAGAGRADVILPGAAYTEKSATYVNVEGRPQRTALAIFPPGDAREDWTIVRAFSEAAGRTLPYDTLAQVRARLADANPVFDAVDEIVPAEWEGFGGDIADAAPDSAPFRSPVGNFYMTDPISRCSETMAQCTQMRRSLAAGDRTGTDG
ncbi:MAG: NADH-quinone oxidoreductase subunit NuoG [Rhodospirillaceae bacterium]|nr:NADH-quinone oxidoreductase subunit NuoG [Rhodospirillaceae bacterium]